MRHMTTGKSRSKRDCGSPSNLRLGFIFFHRFVAQTEPVVDLISRGVADRSKARDAFCFDAALRLEGIA